MGTPLIRTIFLGNKIYENLSNVIHLSGRFVYPDDLLGTKVSGLTRLHCIHYQIPQHTSSQVEAIRNLAQTLDISQHSKSGL